MPGPFSPEPERSGQFAYRPAENPISSRCADSGDRQDARPEVSDEELKAMVDRYRYTPNSDPIR
jgi:hypothetical protein